MKTNQSSGCIGGEGRHSSTEFLFTRAVVRTEVPDKFSNRFPLAMSERSSLEGLIGGKEMPGKRATGKGMDETEQA